MAAVPGPFAAQWRRVLEVEPGDWSQLACELRLSDSQTTESAVVICAPLNPWIADGDYRSGVLRFTVAHTAGYGAAWQVVSARMAMLDEAGIEGSLRVLRGVDGVRLVATQGTVL